MREIGIVSHQRIKFLRRKRPCPSLEGPAGKNTGRHEALGVCESEDTFDEALSDADQRGFGRGCSESREIASREKGEADIGISVIFGDQKKSL